jgi:hypothetical protein
VLIALVLDELVVDVVQVDVQLAEEAVALVVPGREVMEVLRERAAAAAVRAVAGRVDGVDAQALVAVRVRRVVPVRGKRGALTGETRKTRVSLVDGASAHLNSMRNWLDGQ